MTIDDVTWTVFLHFVGNSFFHWPMWLSIFLPCLQINHGWASPTKNCPIICSPFDWNMETYRFHKFKLFMDRHIYILVPWSIWESSVGKGTSLEVWPGIFPMMSDVSENVGTLSFLDLSEKYWNGGFNELLNYFCLWFLEGLRFRSRWFNLVQVMVFKICLFSPIPGEMIQID